MYAAFENIYGTLLQFRKLQGNGTEALAQPGLDRGDDGAMAEAMTGSADRRW